LRWLERLLHECLNIVNRMEGIIAKNSFIKSEGLEQKSLQDHNYECDGTLLHKAGDFGTF